MFFVQESKLDSLFKNGFRCLKPSIPHPFHTLLIIIKFPVYLVQKIELYWQ